MTSHLFDWLRLALYALWLVLPSGVATRLGRALIGGR